MGLCTVLGLIANLVLTYKVELDSHKVNSAAVPPGRSITYVKTGRRAENA